MSPPTMPSPRAVLGCAKGPSMRKQTHKEEVLQKGLREGIFEGKDTGV